MYSQAIHYANRMVYLLIPLDIGNKASKQEAYDDERASNSIANRYMFLLNPLGKVLHRFNFVYSVAESDSADAESGFEDQDPSETGSAVIRIVSRFIDRVCNEGNWTYNNCVFFCVK